MTRMHAHTSCPTLHKLVLHLGHPGQKSLGTPLAFKTRAENKKRSSKETKRQQLVMCESHDLDKLKTDVNVLI